MVGELECTVKIVFIVITGFGAQEIVVRQKPQSIIKEPIALNQSVMRIQVLDLLCGSHLENE